MKNVWIFRPLVNRLVRIPKDELLVFLATHEGENIVFHKLPTGAELMKYRQS